MGLRRMHALQVRAHQLGEGRSFGRFRFDLSFDSTRTLTACACGSFAAQASAQEMQRLQQEAWELKDDCGAELLQVEYSGALLSTLYAECALLD